MSRPPPSLPIRLPKEPGVLFPVRTAATACRSRPRSVPAISSAWAVMCGCASVPVETAASSSRTLRPRPAKPIAEAAVYSSARSIPRVMRIRIVRRIGLQNALCSGIRAGVQGIRCSCCPIRFMGSCRRIRIQGCSGGMIFYRIKKVFGNSLRRRFCKLRIKNGEWRITQWKSVVQGGQWHPCGYARCRWVTSGAPRSHPTVSSVIKQNPQMPSMTTEQTSCATRVCRACVELPICVAVRNPALRRVKEMGAHCAPLR